MMEPAFMMMYPPLVIADVLQGLYPATFSYQPAGHFPMGQQEYQALRTACADCIVRIRDDAIASFQHSSPPLTRVAISGAFFSHRRCSYQRSLLVVLVRWLGYELVDSERSQLLIFSKPHASTTHVPHNVAKAIMDATNARRPMTEWAPATAELLLDLAPGRQRAAELRSLLSSTGALFDMMVRDRALATETMTADDHLLHLARFLIAAADAPEPNESFRHVHLRGTTQTAYVTITQAEHVRIIRFQDEHSSQGRPAEQIRLALWLDFYARPHAARGGAVPQDRVDVFVRLQTGPRTWQMLDIGWVGDQQM
jgi:hypothetical protein